MGVAGTRGDIVAWGWSMTGRRLEEAGSEAARRLDGEEDERRWLVDKVKGEGAMVMCGEEAQSDMAAARCRFAYNCDAAVCLDCHGLMFLLEDDALLPLLPSTTYKGYTL
ncbi:hypothetical protein CFC21_037269 [Triticum aestivum]|uniref:Uncharacterized protein n=3 Tax=Triticum TaxID=4564 RepID=A0A9R0RYN2_TRITD|nr:hypothetical protein CFC21_037269 [Triticum aestivum]VAH66903.1 unnamed protein product [Triticum turgidum subsp. durum]